MQTKTAINCFCVIKNDEKGGEGDLLYQFEELGGDAGAGGEDADAVVVAVAFDGGSGLLGDEFAGACVPLLEVQFPVAVEPA